MRSRCPTLLSGRSNRLSALVHLGTATDCQAAGGQSRNDRRTACTNAATQHQTSTRGAERAAGWVADSEGNEASASISTLSEEERWDKTACRMLDVPKGCWAKGPLLHSWLSCPAPVSAVTPPFDDWFDRTSAKKNPWARLVKVHFGPQWPPQTRPEDGDFLRRGGALFDVPPRWEGACVPALLTLLFGAAQR